MNNTKEKTNTDSTGTAINNTVTNKDIFSHISQKQIIDKSTGKIIEFIVISDQKFGFNDWLLKTKFIDIAPKLGSKPLDYLLKKTLKGDPDEGKEGQIGKALRFSIGEDNITVGVYTQVQGEAWQLNHTHTVEKTLFDAYTLIVKNDVLVSEVEKKQKSPENFSLNLG